MSARLPLVPRPGYESLRAYSPGEERPCAIDLSDNTNLWGMPPAAAAALRDFPIDRATRYPSRYGEALKQVIAGRHGVSPEMVVTGPGSDGVLDAAIRAFAVPGARMALPEPTFVMAAPFAVMNGVTPVPVPLTPDYDADAEALLATDAELVYLCSPNNPTGRALRADTIERVIAGARGLVIIDEAYADFADGDAAALARRSDRVLLTRTLSKAFGLAGLRIGYGIAPADVVTAIEKARGPYAVSAHAEAAGIAALTEGSAWVAARVADARDSRTRLAAGLRALGLAPVESDANFLFVPAARASEIAESLAVAGIAVRAFRGLRAVSPALEASGGSALRITVGPAAVMDTLLESLAGIVGEGAAA